MSVPKGVPLGDPKREAIDSLRGYVYQIYQSALAWTDLKVGEFLFLEVAEDYAITASNALEAVQVKDTKGRVTINSDDIIASLDSFVEIQEKNPKLNVFLRHLTTSHIGKERSAEHRVGEIPTLIAWRNLAKIGELSELRRVLDNSKLSAKSKSFIGDLSDTDLRERFLRKIHFDCGAPDSKFLSRQLNSKVSELIIERGGVHSQATGCIAVILHTLLKLSTTKNREDRFVDRTSLEELLEAATHITLKRAHFDTQNRLMEKLLLASVPSGIGLSSSRIAIPSLVSAPHLPNALANRDESIAQLQQSLESASICWITGAAGMGKTVAARVLAHNNEGEWASINLRGQQSEQVVLLLSQVADSMPNFGLRGLIVDDLDCTMEPFVLDGLNYLRHSANRSDVLLVVISSNPPTSDFLFASDLNANIAFTLTEFTEKDIKEILEKIEVKESSWVKYIHLVSGGGHPQLAVAFIQSMAASNWNPTELQTFNSLLTGSPAVDEVRKRTRERLLRDLPDTARRLIERLSLKAGGFGRELALDLSNIEPPIQDAGIVLDSLTGSWIDQNEGDRFNLSPLISDYATRTLTTEEKKRIQSAIADSLTKGNSFDVIDINSALFAALGSRNNVAILKLCMAVFGTEHDKIDVLAPYLYMFTLFSTDTIAYPSDATLSHMLRGAQLLLLNQDSCASPSKLKDALRCFSEEARNVQNESKLALTSLLVYSKLMLHNSKAGIGVNFIGVIRELAELFKKESEELPLEGVKKLTEEGISPIGFMFLNQVIQLSKIEALTTVFDFLDSSSSELRSSLLAPFRLDGYNIDLMVTGAWLSEHKNNTIVPSVHSTIFAYLEKKAMDWSHTDLAVCCRKFQAIILDECGNDRESALAILDEGLTIYGLTNSELVREKAKVLYRSGDHEGNLALSKTLIKSDAPINEIEKAYLGRDAAISAEKQGDFETARQYYLYGSEAAKKSKAPNLVAMYVGLLADAALASWHNGDRSTCLQDFISVLKGLNQFSADETLCTAHCHAVTRHVLFWLDQDATGEARLFDDSEETKIYPGCVSNPEPHSEIGEHYIISIEIAWYILAAIENHASLDVGITQNLEKFLPNGPVLEGQIHLIRAKIYNAFSLLDIKLFIDALKEKISCFAFIQANRENLGELDIKNVTYGTFPLATKDQQEKFNDISEQYVLLYFSMCVLKEDIESISEALRKLAVSNSFVVRPIILDRMQKSGPVNDFYADFAQLVRVHALSLSGVQQVLPVQVFSLAFKILQLAKATGNYQLFSKSLLPWLERKWLFIWERQRFLLSNLSLNEAAIKAAFNQQNVPNQLKVVNILSAILPTLGDDNKELKQILTNLLK